jgi:hypothetical protein
MKRDMDFVREILLKIEASDGPLEVIGAFVPTDDEGERDTTEEQRVYQYVDWLKQAGFIATDEWLSPLGAEAVLTWQGCEFLDTIRDPELWKKTKAGAKSVGSASVAIMGEIAKGYLKQAIRDNLHLPL